MRLYRQEITTRLSCRFNFLAIRGLTLLFAGVASFASAVLAIVPSLIAKYYFDFGFRWSELAIGAALVVLSVPWFL